MEAVTPSSVEHHHNATPLDPHHPCGSLFPQMLPLTEQPYQEETLYRRLFEFISNPLVIMRIKFSCLSGLDPASNGQVCVVYSKIKMCQEKIYKDSFLSAHRAAPRIRFERFQGGLTFDEKKFGLVKPLIIMLTFLASPQEQP